MTFATFLFPKGKKRFTTVTIVLLGLSLWMLQSSMKLMPPSFEEVVHRATSSLEGPDLNATLPIIEPVLQTTTSNTTITTKTTITTNTINTTGDSASNSSDTPRPKIAILSGFVTKKHGPRAPRIKATNIDHMINKACYANIWGYDFIFNTTWGFDRNVQSRYWLKYGTWHRVPHMVAALPHYDWLVYADVDWYIRDLTIPLESFIKDWELHGFRNVSVFVPVDVPGFHTFSAYVVMIRNNAFGRRVLHHWMRFAQGLCSQGNFNTTPGKYSWGDSDQPGIWYALAKTHAEFAGNQFDVQCVQGKIATGRFLGPEMRAYFTKHRVLYGGNQGKDLYRIPKGMCLLEFVFVASNDLTFMCFPVTLVSHSFSTLLPRLSTRPTHFVVQCGSPKQGWSWYSKNVWYLP